VVHLLQPVKGSLDVGDPIALLHLAAHIEQGFGADEDVQLGPVGGTDLAVAAIAGDLGQDADPQLVKQRQDIPQLAGNVVLADEVNVAGSGVLRGGGADNIVQQGFSGQTVA
jgi:hypothetical protein